MLKLLLCITRTFNEVFHIEGHFPNAISLADVTLARAARRSITGIAAYDLHHAGDVLGAVYGARIHHANIANTAEPRLGGCGRATHPRSLSMVAGKANVALELRSPYSAGFCTR